MWVPLGSAAALAGGYPFRGAVRSEPGGDVAVVQLQEASQADGEPHPSVPRMSNRDHKYDRHLLNPGDVLIQARGHRNPAAVVRLGAPAISAPGLHVLRPHTDRLTSSYLVWCLNHPKTQAAIASVAQGTHAPFISKQALSSLLIPVPPLAVQQRIAEVDGLRGHERLLVAQLEAAQDSLVNGVTWEAAVASARETQ
jgi:hypothetical protein